jgi:glycosyltransferase involved in cell wall biosynthesis
MIKPIVSVGIPFFNAQTTLFDAVRSVLAQTLQEWELVLVDDGSTDGSLDLAQSIDDPRIRVLPPDATNKRLPARLNQIARAAQGEFIARMDADDLSHPERFARQSAFLDACRDIDVVGSSMYIIDQHSQPVSKIIVPERHDVICKNRFKGVGMAHATVMGRREWFRRNPYDESNIRNEDFELWVRTCRDSVFANISDPLYYCNEFAASSFSKYARSKWTEAQVVMQYGSAQIGKLQSVYHASRKYCQIAVYAGFTILGLRNVLVRRRYSILTAQEQIEANRVIDLLRRTAVPVKKRRCSDREC